MALSGRERKYGDVFSQSSLSFVLVLGSRKKGNSRTKDEDDDERKIHHSICGPDSKINGVFDRISFGFFYRDGGFRGRDGVIW